MPVDRVCASARRGVDAAVGSCSNQLGDPRPAFIAVVVVIMALGVDTAGPDESNCVNKASS